MEIRDKEWREGFREGFKEGFREGIIIERERITIALLKADILTVSFISKIVNLSEIEVLNLARKNDIYVCQYKFIEEVEEKISEIEQEQQNDEGVKAPSNDHKRTVLIRTSYDPSWKRYKKRDN